MLRGEGLFMMGFRLTGGMASDMDGVMNHRALREAVCRANQDIVSAGLVLLTWGNASACDREAGLMGIKPSGVDYAALRPEDIVLLSLDSGEVVEGRLRPSSDTPTHLQLYRAFPGIGGVVHTHSTCATAWAQSRLPLPCYGTTHADHFYGEIPVARELSPAEIAEAYEHFSGVAITDVFAEQQIDPLQVSAALLPGHGPFAWGKTLEKAVENAIVLEEAARMALHTLALRPAAAPLRPELLQKHFFRKHGPGATYGQELKGERLEG
jgi:L-ribulose-5-phosphate 4-epimerase